MAKKTFWWMFNKVVRKVWLTNTFSDWAEETESIKEDINDIQKQVLSMSKTYLKKAGVLIVWGTVASQREYDIPDNVDKITLVQVTVDTRDYFPRKLSIQDFNRLANTEQISDTPIYYTIDKTKLNLYPTPATSSNVIELNANIYATDLDTDPNSSIDETTELEIKEWFENVIYYYALNEAYERQEDVSLWDRQEAKYTNILKDYKNEVRNSTNSVVVKHNWNNTVNPNRNFTLT